MFTLTKSHLSRESLADQLRGQESGALVVFEGWVRNNNQGKGVESLEYQIYEELAQKEGERILAEAKLKFNLKTALITHRHGHLQLGDIAVWIGATSTHRDDAFKATRFMIDEIKHRLPIWKKEHYTNEKADWVYCKHHHHHVHFEESDYYQKQAQIINQSILKAAKVLVVGAGGLGCPVLINLASAGVGKITIADFDKIHISNIHRQPLFTPSMVGEKKSIIAQQRLSELNPYIEIESIEMQVEAKNVEKIIKGFDLILDCTDNLHTKYLLHDACFIWRRPLISASVYKSEGQIRTFVPGSKYGCLRCYNKLAPLDSYLGNCNNAGVLGVTTSWIGSLQASEAIEFLIHKTNSTLVQTHYLNIKDVNTFKVLNSRTERCDSCDGKIEINQNDYEVTSEILKQLETELIDIRELSNEEIFQLVSLKNRIVLKCEFGVRSRSLVEQLRAEGHTQFYSLKGGACSLSHS